MWQYKANNVNEDILKNPLLESHQRILQNNGYLYYIGRHQDTNPNYAHSSNTVEALGLPKKVDYDNLPPGWKRRIIFIGEDYKQVQDKEAKLLETAYYDHDWDKYLNKAWWHKDHLFGGAGENCKQYNKVDIFNLATEEYSQAKVYGTKPRPMDGHTATIVEE